MNRNRRTRLRKLSARISELHEELEALWSEEQEACDKKPNADTEPLDKLADAVSALDDAATICTEIGEGL